MIGASFFTLADVIKVFGACQIPLEPRRWGKNLARRSADQNIAPQHNVDVCASRRASGDVAPLI